jgi:hypothetical protein
LKHIVLALALAAAVPATSHAQTKQFVAAGHGWVSFPHGPPVKLGPGVDPGAAAVPSLPEGSEAWMVNDVTQVFEVVTVDGSGRFNPPTCEPQRTVARGSFTETIACRGIHKDSAAGEETTIVRSDGAVVLMRRFIVNGRIFSASYARLPDDKAAEAVKAGAPAPSLADGRRFVESLAVLPASVDVPPVPQRQP